MGIGTLWDQSLRGAAADIFCASGGGVRHVIRVYVGLIHGN